MLPSYPLTLFLLLLSACSASYTPPQVCFYAWKLQWRAEELSTPSMARFSPPDQPLFLHFLDVDYSAGYGGAVPSGELFLDNFLPNRPIVPVVFIVNRVFSKLQTPAIDSLASKIARKIERRTLYWAQHSLPWDLPHHFNRDSFALEWQNQFIREIQIDCDWTENTRNAFFQFLIAFQKEAFVKNRTVSCTVRLHQFRDRKPSGIPPVDRATLMCYNMADPKDTSVQNAIFDLGLLQGYVNKQPDYPLPLDIALPVFNWGVWFRSGEYRGLLSNFAATDTAIFSPKKANIFQLKRDTVWNEMHYLREGDLIRADGASNEDILAAVPLLKPLLARTGRLLFFDWDTTKINRYEKLIPPVVAGF